MLFNSIEFALFLPVVFFLYWFLVNRNLRIQNLFLVAVSYFFYGWWDVRFLALIAFSSVVDYLVGIGLGRTEAVRTRKLLLLTSIVVNIGFLALFKYFNFFAVSFSDAFRLFGRPLADPVLLNIVLPIGISFYTFQTLSYAIDIYQKRLEPTRDAIAFFAYVSFFPQLVAGPIERATHLLPQFLKKRTFSEAAAGDGLRQILWGLFKKVVIADNCAPLVNEIFQNHQSYGGSTLLLGAFLFAVQIYCDFSGYSDIAIGTARLFGFSLMRNFAFPYFSRDIAEFWRRWHISLSTWFRDYVYIPMGGSRCSTWKQVRNIFIVFVVSGFWHGANWTFLAWGALNAIFFLPLMLLNRNRIHTDTVAESRLFPSPRELLQMGVTFSLTLLAWVFFRAESLPHAFSYLAGIFSTSLFSPLQVRPSILVVGLCSVLIVVEWLQREKEHALQFHHLPVLRPLRWGYYYGLLFAILRWGGEQQEFIYFQF